ncbi:acylphosphatase [Candidatus Gottesmanbacteria bacterium]|nr:acylphosphatase [Candidatus Gottesmanbacteria bacterium]
MDSKRVHIFIKGDVIGVGFRTWTVRKAVELGVTGWVRNKDHEMVEAVFEGKKKDVDKMVAACRKGPEVSYVETLVIQNEAVPFEFSDFQIHF